jgi:hypothetical protein
MSLIRLVPTLLSGSAVDPAITYRDGILAYTPLAFYDANSSNLWQASDGTTAAVANGDVIGRWDDLSGNGHHLTQATTANKPTLKTNTFGTLKAIDPDGGDNMVVPFTSVASSYTFYAVLDLVAADLNSANHYLFDTAPAARLILGFFAGAANELAWFDGATHAPGAAESAGKKLVVWKLTSGGNGTIYNNGASLGSEAYTAIAIGGNTRIFAQRLGTSEFFNSPLGAFAVFNTAHNDATREAIQTLFNTRYGVY